MCRGILGPPVTIHSVPLKEWEIDDAVIRDEGVNPYGVPMDDLFLDVVARTNGARSERWWGSFDPDRTRED